MRFFHLFAVAITLFFGILATDNGLQKDVEWDNGSLMINGERVMIMSGEFRTLTRWNAPTIRESYADSYCRACQTTLASPSLNYGSMCFRSSRRTE
jgi:hypothetical protein